MYFYQYVLTDTEKINVNVLITAVHIEKKKIFINHDGQQTLGIPSAFFKDCNATVYYFYYGDDLARYDAMPECLTSCFHLNNRYIFLLSVI